MGDVQITHAETGAVVSVPDSAVMHYRQSGWVTVAERDEHDAHARRLAALAEKLAAVVPEKAAEKAADSTTGDQPALKAPAVARKTAGGGTD